MKRRDFIAAGVCCSLTACMPLKFKISNNNSNKIDMLKFMITQHCNLGCKSCISFSTIAEEEYCDINNFEKTLKRLAKITDSQIDIFQIFGGEPLLHPQIENFFVLSRNYLPKTNIQVITNGILLNSMPNSFWESLNLNNIELAISLYPVDIDYEMILEKAKKFDIKMCKQVEVVTNNKDILKKTIYLSNIEDIKKHETQFFGKHKIILSGDANHICTNKNWYKIIDEKGNLYHCVIPSFIIHFNKKFNKNIELVENSDYVNIFKIKNKDEIFKFLNADANYCFNYCQADRGEFFAWCTSSDHPIEEWT